MVRRILVIGSSGTGKSTLARAIGPKLGLPVIHLDREYWQPGWIEPDAGAWHDRVRMLVERDLWVMDGNYRGTWSLRVPRADAIIWLDLPRRIYFPRTALRILRNYGRVRLDAAPRCPERFDRKFLFDYVWKYPRRSRPGTIAMLEGVRRAKRVIVLRRPHEVRAFIAGLPETLHSS